MPRVSVLPFASFASLLLLIACLERTYHAYPGATSPSVAILKGHVVSVDDLTFREPKARVAVLPGHHRVVFRVEYSLPGRSGDAGTLRGYCGLFLETTRGHTYESTGAAREQPLESADESESRVLWRTWVEESPTGRRAECDCFADADGRWAEEGCAGRYGLGA